MADIDRYLELRMRRQKRLFEGMRLTAIVGEAAIRQQVGGPGILHEQLRHINRVVREHDNCVEVASVADSVVIRDSKHPAGMITFSRQAWVAVLCEVRERSAGA